MHQKDSSKEARRHLVNACFNPCDLIGFERTMRDSVKNLLLIGTVLLKFQNINKMFLSRSQTWLINASQNQSNTSYC